jgi:arylsulfatase
MRNERKEIMKILFIAIDTLRADHLSSYGYKFETSPNIDSLADEGVIFFNAFANGIPTTPGFTTIFTGLHSINHRIVSHGGDETIDNSIPLLPEILRDNGYRTCAVDNLFNIKPYFGRGYEYYINPKSKNLHHIRAEEINFEAIRWIKEHHKEDFFLFLHYWDCHTPYLPPEEYWSIFYKGEDPFDPDNHSMDPAKDQIPYPFFKKWHYDLLGNPTDANYITAHYDGAIKYVDSAVGEILDVLKQLGIYDETLVILTADHGENMTEHNFFFDHQGLYEPTIHIPLIIRIGDRFPSRKIDSIVQHIDILPTLLDVLDITVDSKFDGKSLLPLIKGETDRLHREVVSTECTWRAGISIRTEDWKLIKTIDQGLYSTPPKELFNLREDPKEEVNLYDREEDIRDEFELRLTRWLEDRLGNRPDPIRLQAVKGLPAKKWVERTLRDMHIDWDEWVTKRQRFI